MKKFLIKFQSTEQVGPDDYRSVFKEKMFEEDTKLYAIKDWIIANDGYRQMPNGYRRIVEVTLSEPQ
jgi:hypothetical protein